MAKTRLDLAGVYGGALTLEVTEGSTGAELVVTDREGGSPAQLSPDGRQMLRLAAMGSAFLTGANQYPELEEPVDGHWDRFPALTGEVTMTAGVRDGEFVLGVNEKDGSPVPLIALDAERLGWLVHALGAGGHDL